MMKYLFNTTNKPFLALVLIYTIATTNSLQAMYPHNTVIIKNENDDNLSSLQINYTEVEMLPSQKTYQFGKKSYIKPNLIGRNTILNSATETKCRIATNEEISLLEIRNPKAAMYGFSPESTHYGLLFQRVKSLQLRTHNNDIITIEAKKNDRINIRQNKELVGYIIYQ